MGVDPTRQSSSNADYTNEESTLNDAAENLAQTYQDSGDAVAHLGDDESDYFVSDPQNRLPQTGRPLLSEVGIYQARALQPLPEFRYFRAHQQNVMKARWQARFSDDRRAQVHFTNEDGTASFNSSFEWNSDFTSFRPSYTLEDVLEGNYEPAEATPANSGDLIFCRRTIGSGANEREEWLILETTTPGDLTSVRVHRLDPHGELGAIVLTGPANVKYDANQLPERIFKGSKYRHFSRLWGQGTSDNTIALIYDDSVLWWARGQLDDRASIIYNEIAMRRSVELLFGDGRLVAVATHTDMRPDSQPFETFSSSAGGTGFPVVVRDSRTDASRRLNVPQEDVQSYGDIFQAMTIPGFEERVVLDHRDGVVWIAHQNFHLSRLQVGSQDFVELAYYDRRRLSFATTQEGGEHSLATTSDGSNQFLDVRFQSDDEAEPSSQNLLVDVQAYGSYQVFRFPNLPGQWWLDQKDGVILPLLTDWQTLSQMDPQQAQATLAAEREMYFATNSVVMATSRAAAGGTPPADPDGTPPPSAPPVANVLSDPADVQRVVAAFMNPDPAEHEDGQLRLRTPVAGAESIMTYIGTRAEIEIFELEYQAEGYTVTLFYKLKKEESGQYRYLLEEDTRVVLRSPDGVTAEAKLMADDKGLFIGMAGTPLRLECYQDEEIGSLTITNYATTVTELPPFPKIEAGDFLNFAERSVVMAAPFPDHPRLEQVFTAEYIYNELGFSLYVDFVYTQQFGWMPARGDQPLVKSVYLKDDDTYINPKIGVRFHATGKTYPDFVSKPIRALSNDDAVLYLGVGPLYFVSTASLKNLTPDPLDTADHYYKNPNQLSQYMREKTVEFRTSDLGIPEGSATLTKAPKTSATDSLQAVADDFMQSDQLKIALSSTASVDALDLVTQSTDFDPMFMEYRQGAYRIVIPYYRYGSKISLKSGSTVRLESEHGEILDAKINLDGDVPVIEHEQTGLKLFLYDGEISIDVHGGLTFRLGVVTNYKTDELRAHPDFIQTLDEYFAFSDGSVVMREPFPSSPANDEHFDAEFIYEELRISIILRFYYNDDHGWQPLANDVEALGDGTAATLTLNMRVRNLETGEVSAVRNSQVFLTGASNELIILTNTPFANFVFLRREGRMIPLGHKQVTELLDDTSAFESFLRDRDIVYKAIPEPKFVESDKPVTSEERSVSNDFMQPNPSAFPSGKVVLQPASSAAYLFGIGLAGRSPNAVHRARFVHGYYQVELPYDMSHDNARLLYGPNVTLHSPNGTLEGAVLTRDHQIVHAKTGLRLQLIHDWRTGTFAVTSFGVESALPAYTQEEMYEQRTRYLTFTDTNVLMMTSFPTDPQEGDEFVAEFVYQDAGYALGVPLKYSSQRGWMPLYKRGADPTKSLEGSITMQVRDLNDPSQPVKRVEGMPTGLASPGGQVLIFTLFGINIALQTQDGQGRISPIPSANVLAVRSDAQAAQSFLEDRYAATEFENPPVRVRAGGGLDPNDPTTVFMNPHLDLDAFGGEFFVLRPNAVDAVMLAWQMELEKDPKKVQYITLTLGGDQGYKVELPLVWQPPHGETSGSAALHLTSEVRVISSQGEVVSARFEKGKDQILFIVNDDKTLKLEVSRYTSEPYFFVTPVMEDDRYTPVFIKLIQDLNQNLERDLRSFGSQPGVEKFVRPILFSSTELPTHDLSQDQEEVHVLSVGNYEWHIPVIYSKSDRWWHLNAEWANHPEYSFWNVKTGVRAAGGELVWGTTRMEHLTTAADGTMFFGMGDCRGALMLNPRTGRVAPASESYVRLLLDNGNTAGLTDYINELNRQIVYGGAANIPTPIPGTLAVFDAAQFVTETLRGLVTDTLPQVNLMTADGQFTVQIYARDFHFSESPSVRLVSSASEDPAQFHTTELNFVRKNPFAIRSIGNDTSLYQDTNGNLYAVYHSVIGVAFYALDPKKSIASQKDDFLKNIQPAIQENASKIIWYLSHCDLGEGGAASYRPVKLGEALSPQEGTTTQDLIYNEHRFQFPLTYDAKTQEFDFTFIKTGQKTFSYSFILKFDEDSQSYGKFADDLTVVELSEDSSFSVVQLSLFGNPFRLVLHKPTGRLFFEPMIQAQAPLPPKGARDAYYQALLEALTFEYELTGGAAAAGAAEPVASPPPPDAPDLAYASALLPPDTRLVADPIDYFKASTLSIFNDGIPYTYTLSGGGFELPCQIVKDRSQDLRRFLGPQETPYFLQGDRRYDLPANAIRDVGTMRSSHLTIQDPLNPRVVHNMVGHGLLLSGGSDVDQDGLLEAVETHYDLSQEEITNFLLIRDSAGDFGPVHLTPLPTRTPETMRVIRLDDTFEMGYHMVFQNGQWRFDVEREDSYSYLLVSVYDAERGEATERTLRVFDRYESDKVHVIDISSIKGVIVFDKTTGHMAYVDPSDVSPVTLGHADRREAGYLALLNNREFVESPSLQSGAMAEVRQDDRDETLLPAPATLTSRVDDYQSAVFAATFYAGEVTAALSDGDVTVDLPITVLWSDAEGRYLIGPLSTAGLQYNGQRYKFHTEPNESSLDSKTFHVKESVGDDGEIRAHVGTLSADHAMLVLSDREWGARRFTGKYKGDYVRATFANSEVFLPDVKAVNKAYWQGGEDTVFTAINNEGWVGYKNPVDDTIIEFRTEVHDVPIVKFLEGFSVVPDEKGMVQVYCRYTRNGQVYVGYRNAKVIRICENGTVFFSLPEVGPVFAFDGHHVWPTEVRLFDQPRGKRKRGAQTHRKEDYVLKDLEKEKSRRLRYDSKPLAGAVPQESDSDISNWLTTPLVALPASERAAAIVPEDNNPHNDYTKPPYDYDTTEKLTLIFENLRAKSSVVELPIGMEFYPDFEALVANGVTAQFAGSVPVVFKASHPASGAEYQLIISMTHNQDLEWVPVPNGPDSLHAILQTPEGDRHSVPIYFGVNDQGNENYFIGLPGQSLVGLCNFSAREPYIKILENTGRHSQATQPTSWQADLARQSVFLRPQTFTNDEQTFVVTRSLFGPAGESLKAGEAYWTGVQFYSGYQLAVSYIRTSSGGMAFQTREVSGQHYVYARFRTASDATWQEGWLATEFSQDDGFAFFRFSDWMITLGIEAASTVPVVLHNNMIEGNWNTAHLSVITQAGRIRVLLPGEALSNVTVAGGSPERAKEPEQRTNYLPQDVTFATYPIDTHSALLETTLDPAREVDLVFHASHDETDYFVNQAVRLDANSGELRFAQDWPEDHAVLVREEPEETYARQGQFRLQTGTAPFAQEIVNYWTGAGEGVTQTHVWDEDNLLNIAAGEIGGGLYQGFRLANGVAFDVELLFDDNQNVFTFLTLDSDEDDQQEDISVRYENLEQSQIQGRLAIATHMVLAGQYQVITAEVFPAPLVLNRQTGAVWASRVDFTTNDEHTDDDVLKDLQAEEREHGFDGLPTLLDLFDVPEPTPAAGDVVGAAPAVEESNQEDDVAAGDASQAPAADDLEDDEEPVAIAPAVLGDLPSAWQLERIPHAQERPPTTEDVSSVITGHPVPWSHYYWTELLGFEEARIAASLDDEASSVALASTSAVATMTLPLEFTDDGALILSGLEVGAAGQTQGLYRLAVAGSHHANIQYATDPLTGQSWPLISFYGGMLLVTQTLDADNRENFNHVYATWQRYVYAFMQERQSLYQNAVRMGNTYELGDLLSEEPEDVDLDEVDDLAFGNAELVYKDGTSVNFSIFYRADADHTDGGEWHLLTAAGTQGLVRADVSFQAASSSQVHTGELPVRRVSETQNWQVVHWADQDAVFALHKQDRRVMPLPARPYPDAGSWNNEEALSKEYNRRLEVAARVLAEAAAASAPPPPPVDPVSPVQSPLSLASQLVEDLMASLGDGLGTMSGGLPADVQAAREQWMDLLQDHRPQEVSEELWTDVILKRVTTKWLRPQSAGRIYGEEDLDLLQRNADALQTLANRLVQKWRWVNRSYTNQQEVESTLISEAIDYDFMSELDDRTSKKIALDMTSALETGVSPRQLGKYRAPVFYAYIDRFKALRPADVDQSLWDDRVDQALTKWLGAADPLITFLEFDLENVFEDPEALQYLTIYLAEKIKAVESLGGKATVRKKRFMNEAVAMPSLAEALVAAETSFLNVFSDNVFDLIHAATGEEIDRDLILAVLQETDPALHDFIAMHPDFFPDDLGEWTLQYARYAPHILEQIAQNIQEQDLDVYEHPEALVFELLRAEAQINGFFAHEISDADVRAQRQRFVSELMRARLEVNLESVTEVRLREAEIQRRERELAREREARKARARALIAR